MQNLLDHLTPQTRDWLRPAPEDESLGPELRMALAVAIQHPELGRALDLARYGVVGKQPVILAWAALLVACYDDPKAHTLLDRLLRHSDPRLRRIALEASQIAESPLGLRRAIAATDDPDVGIAASARTLLAAAGPAKLGPLLGQLLDKGDTASVDEAAKALLAVEDPAYVEHLTRCCSMADVALRAKLERLLREEAVPVPAPAAAEPAPVEGPRSRLEELLRRLVKLGGSDLHLKAGLAPYVRREGRMTALKEQPFSAEELLGSMAAVCRPDQMERFLAKGDLDLALGLPGVARFRLNFLRAGGQPALVARVIPTEVPDMAKLGLPQALHDLALSPKGLLLVTGPTGSGKSTTLAAMMDLINSVRRGHIITIEDPVEFIHRDKLSSVTQREVGVDVATFADGVRFALREDPDVLLVGELRDLETVSAAFQAAGAGRLVLGTLHTNSAAKTVERLLNVFPPDEQPQARMSLSLTLTGVISQTLVAKPSGGRVAVHEILIATGAVRKAIREKQTSAIYGLMESGSAAGMTTLEQGLARLVRAKTISREEALLLANEPATLEMH